MIFPFRAGQKNDWVFCTHKAHPARSNRMQSANIGLTMRRFFDWLLGFLYYAPCLRDPVVLCEKLNRLGEWICKGMKLQEDKLVKINRCNSIQSKLDCHSSYPSRLPAHRAKQVAV